MADTTSNDGVNFVAQSGKSKLKVLVVGKTGVGKSALINALVGYEVSEETPVEAGTHRVEEISTELHGGVEAIFYDSPGLHDCKGKEKEYLQQMIDVSQGLDLILYCTKLTDTRITEEDCDTICEFTHAFGKDFWKNSVFVLTFANNVRPKTNINDPEMKKKELKLKIKLMKKKLHEILRSKAKLSFEVVKSIPFVPAGYYTPDHQILPDGTHWFSSFWTACFTRVRDVGKPAVINGCLDMFEVESEKSKMQTPEFQPQSSATPYPMPTLSQPPSYQQAVTLAPSNRRTIPMGIHIPNTSPFQMIPYLITQAVGGMGTGGKIISLVAQFTGLAAYMMSHIDDSDEED